LLMLDIDGFKAFNDRYGHWRGDAVIRMLARIAVEAASRDPDALVSHIGGDDLCVVTTPVLVDEIGRECVRAFDARAPEHYHEDDRRRGYIVTRSRTGRRQQFALMTLSAVAVTAEAEDIEHFGQLFQVLAELKDYVKSQPGSTYFRDRRRHHGWRDGDD
ncbi:MAG: diguanylate cyclase, partial [Armatimonadetes bacterium]|nr:diguanylate cyclase [Armatimonadota bacterium]